MILCCCLVGPSMLECHPYYCMCSIDTISISLCKCHSWMSQSTLPQTIWDELRAKIDHQHYIF